MQIIDMTSLARFYVSTTKPAEVYLVALRLLEEKRGPKNGSSEN